MCELQLIPDYPWLNIFYKNIIYQFTKKKNHHAFIICSIHGIGTIFLINKIIQWLLCTNKNNYYSCNICKNCTLLIQGYHPDVYIIKKDKLNYNISIEKIRDIIKFINMKAYQDMGKIIWLPDANMLNISSSNGLLKIIEEPLQNTWFFLQSNHINTLLPTITSRCQIWHICPPNEYIGLSWLQKKLYPTTYNINELLTALRINYYAPINAYKLLNSIFWDNRKKLYTTFIIAIKCDILKLLNILNNVNILLYLNWIYILFIDIIKIHCNINTNFIYNLDQIDLIYKISTIITKKQILLMIKKILYYRNIVININNINRELIIVQLLLSLEKILK
ncbi:DNA polymerase III subunit delta' C-terminal domain-containing protein [Enterobacteriaceae endosymbiont of Neohaemonia nigricornis]|uniref:DNA polymerase III subunit delta' C-terminal domain-containing protein n=1 Tax=Enterobacteriaceae endosymbiont of Neohaemonia nigricornis TaxID=2675792 RepID=UPI0014491D7B|nr:DNA polymerase III subunit delta' C-terminal domain-containing protein [Enterobacteriaceae endosymbiont of Neohaemonia nigricornis]QJC30287.1 hypothetical protein GJT85_00425 [Enterobacteriaceae endosymbiont of Neohaemonia nigricornis]